jgi:uncharacterized protein (DUF1778 family)
MPARTRRPRGGRPPLAASEVRAERLEIRLRAEERRELDEAAERAGLSLSAWMRRVLLRAARRSLAR